MRVRRVLALALMPIFVAFATSCSREDPRPQASSFDRQAERAAAIAAVLEQVFHEGSTRYVVDPAMGPERLGPFDERDLEDLLWDRANPPVRLSDGRLVFVPALAGIKAGTVTDWTVHAQVVSAPRDLHASLPIVWFSRKDWTGWDAFHTRFGLNAEWIQFSDVGFSPSGDQALVFVARSSDGEAGSGDWHLLQRVDGRWRIAVSANAYLLDRLVGEASAARTSPLGAILSPVRGADHAAGLILAAVVLILGGVGPVVGRAAAEDAPPAAPPAPAAPAPKADLPRQTIDLGDGVTFEMVLIPAGEFDMGSPETEEGRSSDEVLHRVRITKPYWLATTELTQAVWEA